MSLIAAQEIIVEWTKQSRGGEGTRLRNALPDALPLPSIAQIDAADAFMRDQVTFSEQDRFQFPRHKVTVEPLEPRKKIHLRCVTVTLDDETVTALFVYNGMFSGAPSRTHYPRKVLTLMRGQWGRIVYNGRFAWEGNWTYRKTVLNIGYFERLTDNVFLTEPQRTFSELADLR